MFSLCYIHHLYSIICYSCFMKIHSQNQKILTCFKIVLHIFSFPEEAGQGTGLVPFHSRLPNLFTAFTTASALLTTLTYRLHSPAYSCPQKSSEEGCLLHLHLYGEAPGRRVLRKDGRNHPLCTKKTHKTHKRSVTVTPGEEPRTQSQSPRLCSFVSE